MEKVKQTTTSKIDKDSLDEKYLATKELQEYSKNPNVGINWEIPEAFAYDHKFKINPEGHLKKNKDKIRAIQKKVYTNVNEAMKTNDLYKSNDILEAGSKELLELGLVGFNYDEWANHIDLGPTVLEQMANEVGTFLVVQGGKAGYQHWLMQQKSAMLTLSTHSNISTD